MKKRGKPKKLNFNGKTVLLFLILLLLMSLIFIMQDSYRNKYYSYKIDRLKSSLGNFFNLHGNAIYNNLKVSSSPVDKTRVLYLTSSDINEFKEIETLIENYGFIESMLPPFIIAHVDSDKIEIISADSRIRAVYSSPIALADISFTNIPLTNKVILRRWNSGFPGQKGYSVLSSQDDNLDIDYWDLPIENNNLLTKEFQILANHPLTDLPNLTYNNQSHLKIFLDFDGDIEEYWGAYSNIITPAYDQDGDPTTFSDGELASINDIFLRVVEMYSPYNISVTTIDPGTYPAGHTLKVVIGGGGAWTGGTYGGVAYVGSFSFGPNIVFVFPNNLGSGNTKYTAIAIAHESGHGFILRHQSLYDVNGVKTQEYYTGDSNRAPIMGNAYSSVRGLWWNGTSLSNYTIQSDVERLSTVIPYINDDHSNNISISTNLSQIGNQFTGSGIIQQINDSDFFRFSLSDGNLNIKVNVSNYGPMLDSYIILYNSSYQSIATSNTTSFSEVIDIGVNNGTYYLGVFSNGRYGDLGQYTVLGNITLFPEVTLLSPADNFYTSSNSLFFIANFSHYISFDNTTFYLWNSSRLINTTVIEISGTRNLSNLSFTLPYEGIFLWNYLGYDIDSIFSFAPTNYTVTYDATSPSITFGNLTESNDSILTRNNLIINVTAIDTNLANITIRVYNSTNIINTSVKTSSPFYVNIVNLSNGIYYFNATALDRANNANNTGTRIVNIISSYPQFSNYWDDNSTLTGNGTGRFNVTVVNTNGTVILDINGSEISAINQGSNVYTANYTFISSGSWIYNWTSFGNDSNHYLNFSSNRYYTVNQTPDTTSPSFINPRNFSTGVNYSFSGHINASDNIGISSYKLNDSSIFSINKTSGLLINNTLLTNISIYWLNLTVNDTSGNKANLIFYINVTRDITPPNITFNCSTLSVNVGEILTCSCSSNDDLDNNPNIIYFTNPITSSAGTFDISCIAIDKAGNNYTSILQYTVSAFASPSGGGSSGGGGSRVVVKKNVTQNSTSGNFQNISIVNLTEIPIIISEETLNVFTEENYTLNVSEEPKEINWYINDRLVSSGSNSYNLNNLDEGNYTVRAELIDNNVKKLKKWNLIVSNKEKALSSGNNFFLILFILLISSVIIVLIYLIYSILKIKKFKISLNLPLKIF